MEFKLGGFQDEQGNPIPVPLSLWATFPIEAKMVILLMAEQIGALERRVEELEEQVRANSTNSSKPPSADPPGTPRRRHASSGHKPGGQPGHPGHSRKLLPPEAVTHREDCFPPECRKCGVPLPAVPCHVPLRDQVIELPRVHPDVIEYVRHRVQCPCCAVVTTARRPVGAPPGSSRSVDPSNAGFYRPVSSAGHQFARGVTWGPCRAGRVESA